MAAIDPDAACVCGHTYDEHANRAVSRMGCVAPVPRGGETYYCMCTEFDPVEGSDQ